MKKENMNNKGFSLVELIIVIAIMAILIVVLAPQYLRYVEKSRVSSDQTTIVEYINAMQVIAADPDISLTSGTDYSLKSNAGDAGITVSGPLATLLETQGMLDATAAAGGNLQSTAYTDVSMDIQLVYNSANKIWNVEAATGSGVEVSGQLTKTP